MVKLGDTTTESSDGNNSEQHDAVPVDKTLLGKEETINSGPCHDPSDVAVRVKIQERYVGYGRCRNYL